MPSGVNKVFIVGNLGRDPEVHYTQSGSAVCKFPVAAGERRKKDGEWVDHTEWVRAVCFGKTAENAGQYLSKGRQVHIEGRLSTQKWTDKEGVDRWSTDVIIDRLTFLGGGGDKGGKSSPSKPPGEDRGGGGGGGDSGFYDDDLPF